MPIPKIYFTYWEGDQLSQLHYFTVLSLFKLNPNIKIIIYTTEICSTTNKLVQWNSHEQSVKINNTISLDTITSISTNIILKKINFENEYSILNEISYVFKADFIRIAKLYEHGGLWFDFDVLFIKSFPKFLFEDDIDIFYFTYANTIPTGLLLSTPKNEMISILYSNALDTILQINNNSLHDYQILGPNIWNEYFVKYPDLLTNSKCLLTNMCYPYLWYNCDMLFDTNNDIITEDTFCIHWYNGGISTRKFINSFNKNFINPNKCVLEKYLHNIICTNFIKLRWVNSEDYIKTYPYPYMMQDDFLDNDFAKLIQHEILNIKPNEWDRYNNPFEQKYTVRDKFNFPPNLAKLFDELTSETFVSELSRIVGYKLLLDTTRNFWGVHMYAPGDKLDIHVDVGLHPTLGFKKQVTLGIYLSYEWLEEYGCHLEIWKGDNSSKNDAKIVEKVGSIAPLFNRLIIFTCNDYSWHGNPEPANCPSNSKRIFVTLSYLSENFEDDNKRMKAYFVARPDDPINEEKDKLRLLRADPDKYKEIYNMTEVDEIIPKIDQTTENTFALHWYNGDKESQNYCSNFNINNTDKERCIFEKLLISTNTTIPCSIISTNTIVQPIKISIVMAFYNRRPQLLFTLKTIRDSQYKNIEIIIVNDASDKEHEIDDILGIYDLDIKIINIKIEEKNWVNPCVSYNIGFKQAVGDIILIQNPEVCHIGDCLTFTINNLKSNDWLSFNCYGLDDFTENKHINDMYTDNLDNCDAIFNYINNKPFKIGGNTIHNNFPGGWINHYDKFFVAYHYMAAIYKDDLFSKMNGGFHDEYRNGTCYDDNDFIKYLIYNNFNFKIPKYSFNNPFCIHQYHDKTTSLYNLELFKINDEIYKKRMKQINASEFCDIVTGFMPNPIVIL